MSKFHEQLERARRRLAALPPATFTVTRPLVQPTRPPDHDPRRQKPEPAEIETETEESAE